MQPMAPRESAKRIIVHMGANKTGSTALQHWFMTHAEALAEAGVAQPLHLIGDRGNGAKLAAAMCESLANAPEGRTRLRDYRNWAAAQQGDILISAEKFSRYAGWRQLGRAGQILTQSGHRPVAVIYLRNQVDRVNSSIAQRLKRLRGTVTDDAMAMVEPSREDWNGVLRHIEQAGFETIAAAFPRPKPQSIARHFCDIAGLSDRLPPGLDFELAQANPSIGECGSVLARSLQELVAGQPPRVTRLVADLMMEALQGLDDRPFNAFSSDEITQITARFAPGNRAIAQQLGLADTEILNACRSATLPRAARDWSELDQECQARLSSAVEHLCALIDEDPRLAAINTAEIMPALRQRRALVAGAG